MTQPYDAMLLSQPAEDPRYARDRRVVASGTLPLILGRYELHSVIATGGMASIHLGRLRGPSGFARTVAIKRLHPHFARDPSFVSMFLDEARLVARIRHPNVVPILDVVAEKDELFLVMEYIHGESLARLVHEGDHGEPTPPAIAAAIFAGVLHGLHAAHEAKSADGEALNMVHRDVTPHNVLVGLDGSARIADFGIAKATRRDQTTKAGVLKGKLGYVAPEQLHGEEVDRAVDVYAAAVSLWEALAGRVLFEGDHEAQLIQKILTGAVRPPSAVVPGIPPELDEVVMRGLEMKPNKRFPTAHDMALALERGIVLPSSSSIGAWVAERAERVLAQRVAKIENLERMAPVAEAFSAAPVELAAPASAPSVPMALAASSTQLATMATTPMAHVMNPTDPSLVTPMRSSRAPWFVALTLLAGVALASGAFLAHWRNTPRSSPPSSVAAVPPTALPAASMPTKPPSDPASDTVSASASAGPLSAKAEPEPVSPKVHHPHRIVPAASASASASKTKAEDACNPPYIRDESGAKIYKRECL